MFNRQEKIFFFLALASNFSILLICIGAVFLPDSPLVTSVIWIFIVEFLSIHSTFMFASSRMKGLLSSKTFLLAFYILFGSILLYFSENYVVIAIFFVSVIGKFLDKSLKITVGYLFRFVLLLLTMLFFMLSGIFGDNIILILGSWGIVYYSGLLLFQIFIYRRQEKIYTDCNMDRENSLKKRI